MNLLQTTAHSGEGACRYCTDILEKILSFFGGKIDAVVGKMAAIGGKVDAIGAEMARLKPQTRRRHGAQYADAKVDAVREAMVRHEESSVARNSENTRRTLRGVFEYSRRLLESVGIATLEQFRKIKHALDVRAYRTRIKELEARESRKEESDSCVEEGVSCDCAREEPSSFAAAPGGCVAPRRNEKGRGAVCPKATFHSPPSHAPDYLISCESCECPSRSDGPPGYSCPNVARKISGTVPAVPLTPMVGKGASLPLRLVLRVFQPPLYGCFRCWEFRSLGENGSSKNLVEQHSDEL